MSHHAFDVILRKIPVCDLCVFSLVRKSLQGLLVLMGMYYIYAMECSHQSLSYIAQRCPGIIDEQFCKACSHVACAFAFVACVKNGVCSCRAIKTKLWRKITRGVYSKKDTMAHIQAGGH